MTVARVLGTTPYGKWGLGLVGYGAWDLQDTVLTREHGGRGEAIGGGAVFGINLRKGTLTVYGTHQFVTQGYTNVAKGDTRIWTSLVIPLWTPQPLPEDPLLPEHGR